MATSEESRVPLPPFTLDEGIEKVRFAYEWRDSNANWIRSYGNENWAFNHRGLMLYRFASINDLEIADSERLFHWPLGRRPDCHPSLSELEL